MKPAEFDLTDPKCKAFWDWLVKHVCDGVGVPDEMIHPIHFCPPMRPADHAIIFDLLTKRGYKKNLITGEYYK